jgi:heme-degrading monooxygenase HmoA
MAVAIFADVPGQTKQMYDGMMAVLEVHVRQAPGFIMHSAFATKEGDWKVVEIWETSKQANEFFASHIHPNLPPGIKPRREFQELHKLVRP